MAERIGLTASIVGIIEGTSKIRTFAKEYLYRSSTLRSELVAMLGKLAVFTGLLQSLKLQAKVDPFNRMHLCTCKKSGRKGDFGSCFSGPLPPLYPFVGPRRQVCKVSSLHLGYLSDVGRVFR
jgi:hypothetical protein